MRFSRKNYKDVYDGIKNVMEGAKQYGYRDAGKDIYLYTSALCTLHGKNDNGIMLNIDTSGNVELFYGKLDTWPRIQKLQTVLEAEPKDTDSLGI